MVMMRSGMNEGHRVNGKTFIWMTKSYRKKKASPFTSWKVHIVYKEKVYLHKGRPLPRKRKLVGLKARPAHHPLNHKVEKQQTWQARGQGSFASSHWGKAERASKFITVKILILLHQKQQIHPRNKSLQSIQRKDATPHAIATTHSWVEVQYCLKAAGTSVGPQAVLPQPSQTLIRITS